MTNMTKKELISVTKKRYLKVGKKDKGKMLDEFCGNIGSVAERRPKIF